MNGITTAEATVYVATWQGKTVRRFTKRGAYSWLAWQMILSSERWGCTCEPDDFDSGIVTPGYTCDAHSGKADAVYKRLTRRLMFQDRKTRKTGEVTP